MGNKKFKLVLDPEKLDLADFDNHALQKNVLSSAKGGFKKHTSYLKRVFNLQNPSGPVS